VIDKDDELLLKIEQQIRSNAFKEETYAYSFKDRQGAPDTLKALTHVYILNTAHRKRSIPVGYRAKLKNIKWKNGCIINLSEKELWEILDDNRTCEEFISRAASTVYNCRHAKKEILAQIKKSEIDDTRRFLVGQIYGKREINNALKILGKGLDTQIKKNVNFYYPPPSKKQSPSFHTKNHENEALYEIYSLYNKYFPKLKPRNIRANMAFITAATNFWKDDREFLERVNLYFERLGNRKNELGEPDDIKIQASLNLPGGIKIPLKN
jgi:hypothetical protein